MFCCTRSSVWVLLILWYKVIDVRLSVIAWSDRRRPNSGSIASLQSNTGSTRTKCSVFKIRIEQITCWHVESQFWVQKHGYEIDDLKNLQLEVFDQKSKPSGFIWLSLIHISFFQKLLVESISSVVWQIVSTSGEKLQAKSKNNATNKPKITMWGHLRTARKETHGVNNPCHSFPCSSLNSTSLLVCVS